VRLGLSESPAKGGGTGQSRKNFRSRSARLFLAVGALALAGGISELVLRLFFHQNLALVQDERNLMYRYDSELGWFPIPGSEKIYTGARTISVRHNSEGFRGPEFQMDDRPRIMFLGDSFVWGVDAEEDERFTAILSQRHPKWSVYNLGVSGYGTDQEYLLLQRTFQRFMPDVVFLIYCAENDDSDNCWNLRHGGYFKPYCVVEGTQLRLCGIPVPRSYPVFCSEHRWLTKSYVVRLMARAYYRLKSPPALHNPNPTGPILRDLQKYVQSRRAVFLIGLTRSHPHLEEFLRHFEIPYADLSTTQRYATFGQHWTPEGNRFVADRIEQFLTEGNYLARSSRLAKEARSAN